MTELAEARFSVDSHGVATDQHAEEADRVTVVPNRADLRRAFRPWRGGAGLRAYRTMPRLTPYCKNQGEST